MSRVFVQGCGAVSSAGWGTPALWAAVEQNQPAPVAPQPTPGRLEAPRFRPVPPPAPRPAWLGHPRLRRASPIALYTVAAGLEAVGDAAARVQAGTLRLGIVVCVMAGNVNYSRRFYEEVLKNPTTASPLLFPETVFNAPASHLAAYLNSPAACYTLVGDDGTFLHGLAVAADWLSTHKVDGCVVIGAEETDWIVSGAIELFHPDVLHSGGAGALYLQREPGPAPIAELATITDAFSYTGARSRAEAVRQMRAQLPPSAPGELLCLGARGSLRADAAEQAAWRDWTGPRLAPQMILGGAFTAAAGWQCVLACEALRRQTCTATNVSVVGANQQAVGARFTRFIQDAQL